jgi:hypothetical protein
MFRLVEKEVPWKPEETAIVIVDMWDDHHCVSAAKRVTEMAPFMNRVIESARHKGGGLDIMSEGATVDLGTSHNHDPS